MTYPSPRADRMQAAFKAAREGGNSADTIIAAVESAMRVQITPAVELAFQRALRRSMSRRLALRAAFEAAGFEVTND